MTAFIDEKRGDFGVEPICRTLEVSASAYYHRKTGARSARQVEDARLLEVIQAKHKANFEAYGYRKMWKTLRRAGEPAPRCQVQRLMAANGLCGAKRRGRAWRTTVPDPGAQRAPDLVKRNFTAEGPDALWVADFTYLRCWEGRAYFSFVIDVFSRKIVGWQFASHMRTDLVLDALRMALGTRKLGADVALVTHSDAGAQYTSWDYAQVIDDHQVLASVGSVGDAFDNALAESFVDSFKTELIKDRVWETRSQMELAILEYVHWFNHARLHQSLDDRPPVEIEEEYHAAQALIPGDSQVPVSSPRPAERLTEPRLQSTDGEIALTRSNSPVDKAGGAKTAPTGMVDKQFPLVSLA